VHLHSTIDAPDGARTSSNTSATITAATHAELVALRDALASSGVRIARILVFERVEGGEGPPTMTSPAAVALVRDVLTRGLEMTGGSDGKGNEKNENGVGAAPAHMVVAGGSDGWFADINRDRPNRAALESMKALAFPASPTVHLADDASVMENIEGLKETATFAKELCTGIAPNTPTTVHVGPSQVLLMSAFPVRGMIRRASTLLLRHTSVHRLIHHLGWLAPPTDY
jgi:hypothetical protein